MPDLQAYAQQKLGGSFTPLSDDDGSGDLDSLLSVAEDIKSQCLKLNLKILCLQPFSQFEGYTDQKKRQAKFKKAEVWMNVMQAVGTDMLQVGSTDDRSTTSDRNVIVKDLQELADMAAKRNMRIGYEVCTNSKSFSYKIDAVRPEELVLGSVQRQVEGCLGDLPSRSARACLTF